MSTFDEEFEALQRPVGDGQEEPSADRQPEPSYPKGWEPGVTWDGTTGEICSGPLQDRITDVTDWDPILRLMGFDPAEFMVIEPVTTKTWFMGYKKPSDDGTTATAERLQLWSYKAQIRRRTAQNDSDWESLLDEVRRHTAPTVRYSGDLSLVVALADWQVGKPDDGGMKLSVRRIMSMIDGVAERLKELRKVGRKINNVYLVGMGDLVENCDGFYAQQTFRVELDRRDQVKLVRRLLVYAIRTLAPLSERLIVSCVPGNHGENRMSGRSFTTFGDNDDVSVFEMVAEVCAENPDAYGHVKFNIPTTELVRVLDISGTVVAFTHGHAARGGGDGDKLMWGWWQKQCMGNQPANDASILVAAHFHHLYVKSQAGRTLMICPAAENGSEWFRESSGFSGMPGTLTFVVGPDGWQDLQVVRPQEVSDGER